MLKQGNGKEIPLYGFTAVTGHIFFLVLLLFSVFFYRERMLYSDPAFFSFLVIDGNDYSVALGRWGTVLSQAIPLFALQHGVSLEHFLQLYSASFILVYYLVFLIIHYGFKNASGSWMLILSLCLTFRLTFYYPTAELYQGIAFTVLLWVIIQRLSEFTDNGKWIGYFFAFSLIVFISFFHQLTLFTVLFVLIYQLISGGLKNKKLIALSIITICWYVIRIKLLTSSSYEKEKMISGAEFLQQLQHFPDLPSTISLKEFLKHQVPLPVIAFIVSLIILFRKNKLMSIYLLLYAVGFAIVVCVTLYKGESRMMLENYYSVFGLFIAFAFYAAFRIPMRNYATIAAVLMIVYSLKGIHYEKYILTSRIRDLNCMISYGQSLDEKKYIISNEHLFAYNDILPSWAFPFESLMLSSLQHPGAAVTFYPMKRSGQLSVEQLSKNNIFLGPEWSPFWFSSNGIRQRFFDLPPGKYRNLSTSQNDTSFHQQLFSNENFTIHPVGGTVRWKKENMFAEVELINKSNQVLNSVPGGANPVYISYHLCDENGKIIKWDNSRSLILLDIYPGKNLVQKVKIDMPDQQGKYKLKFDMVTEGIRWWDINTEQQLILK